MVEETVPLYNVNDGLGGRNGGPYLDEELHRRATMDAARREGREFKEEDLLNGSPAIQLVTPQQLINAHRDASPSSVEITASPVGEVSLPQVVTEVDTPNDNEKAKAENKSPAKASGTKRTPKPKPTVTKPTVTKPDVASEKKNEETK